MIEFVQTCMIEMAVGKNCIGTVHLIPDKILMKQKLDMTMFEITLWNLDYNDNLDGLRVLIVMKRKFVSEIMTTYFPSFLLLAITFATTFFKPFFFEAALSVNLTTMLVMTTIFISKMESLPPTSDIKMIDIWLILCQIYPFVEVVLLTAMEYQREEDIEEKSDILLVKSNSIVDESDTAKSGLKNLVDVFSRWIVPNLKTLGMLLTRFDF